MRQSTLKSDFLFFFFLSVREWYAPLHAHNMAAPSIVHVSWSSSCTRRVIVHVNQTSQIIPARPRRQIFRRSWRVLINDSARPPIASARRTSATRRRVPTKKFDCFILFFVNRIHFIVNFKDGHTIWRPILRPIGQLFQLMQIVQVQ